MRNATSIPTHYVDRGNGGRGRCVNRATTEAGEGALSCRTGFRGFMYMAGFGPVYVWCSWDLYGVLYGDIRRDFRIVLLWGYVRYH